MGVIIRLTGGVFVTMVPTDRDKTTICRDAGGQAPLPQFAQITWFLRGLALKRQEVLCHLAASPHASAVPA